MARHDCSLHESNNIGDAKFDNGNVIYKDILTFNLEVKRIDSVTIKKFLQRLNSTASGDADHREDQIHLTVISTDASHKMEKPEFAFDKTQKVLDIQRKRYLQTINTSGYSLQDNGMEYLYQFCSQCPGLGTYGRARELQTRNITIGTYLWIYMMYQDNPNKKTKPTTCIACHTLLYEEATFLTPPSKRSHIIKSYKCKSALCTHYVCSTCKPLSTMKGKEWICDECITYKLDQIEASPNYFYPEIMQDFYLYQISNISTNDNGRIKVDMEGVLWTITLDDLNKSRPNTIQPEDMSYTIQNCQLASV